MIISAKEKSDYRYLVANGNRRNDVTPIPYVTPTKPTCLLPFIGIQPAIMDENGNELKGESGRRKKTVRQISLAKCARTMETISVIKENLFFRL
jgi:hypothetical protein